MSVPVKRRRCRRMAELVLDEFDVFTLRDEKRSVGVPQIVEAYPA